MPGRMGGGLSGATVALIYQAIFRTREYRILWLFIIVIDGLIFIDYYLNI
jgi:hypothetical protein